MNKTLNMKNKPIDKDLPGRMTRDDRQPVNKPAIEIIA